VLERGRDAGAAGQLEDTGTAQDLTTSADVVGAKAAPLARDAAMISRGTWIPR
jgi:hypothetical protein